MVISYLFERLYCGIEKKKLPRATVAQVYFLLETQPLFIHYVMRITRFKIYFSFLIGKIFFHM